jgi:hypothetical protein
MWPERIPKAEIGHFRPDSEWQQAEIQAAAVAAEGAAEEEGQVAEALEGGPDVSEDALAVDHPATTAMPQGKTPPPAPPPTPLRDTTFRFQLYGPFFKIISYAYRTNATLGNLRILPGTTRPLFVGIQAGDRRATPALHNLWAYADLVAPPAPHARWPEGEERRAAGEAKRGWLDAAVKRRESPAAIAQLALPSREIREKFSRGLVTVEWDDWSMSMCGVCVDEPSMIYLFQFAPTPTESEHFIVSPAPGPALLVFCPLTDEFYPFSAPRGVTEKDGHRFPIPVPDVDRRFREVSEKDPYGMFGIIPGNAGG